MDTQQLQDSLRKGIRAARRGRKEPAQRFLGEVVLADPSNEEAWLWLARVEDKPDRKTVCLERVLSLNPENQWAAEQLAELQTPVESPLGPPPVPSEPPAVPSSTPPPVPPGEAPAEAEEKQPLKRLEPITSEVTMEIVTCPHCNSPLDIRGGEQVKAIACNYCGSVVDLTTDQAAIIGQANKKARAILPIEPGMEATFEDILYQVIGWIRYEGQDGHERWRWDEWLLASKDGDYRWLSYDTEAGFVFQKKIPLAGAIDMKHDVSIPLPDGGKAYVTERAEAKIIGLAGELTWRARVGDKIKYLEAQGGTTKYSVEATDEEVELLAGEVEPEEKIWAGFGRQDMVDAVKQQGQGNSAFRTLGRASIVLLVIAFVSMLCTSGSGSSILNASIPLTQNGADAVIGELPSSTRLHSVSITAANPSNDWGLVTLSKVDKQEKKSLIMTKQFGQSDSQVSHNFRPGSNGPYKLVASLSGGNVGAANITANVTGGIWASRYFVIFAVLAAVIAFISFSLSKGEKPPFSHHLVNTVQQSETKPAEGQPAGVGA